MLARQGRVAVGVATVVEGAVMVTVMVVEMVEMEGRKGGVEVGVVVGGVEAVMTLAETAAVPQLREGGMW